MNHYSDVYNDHNILEKDKVVSNAKSFIDGEIYKYKNDIADIYNRFAFDVENTENKLNNIKININNFIYENKNPPAKGNNAKIIQKWEGYIEEVLEDTFWARIIPIKGEGVEQEVEIYKSAIIEDERSSIENGSVFYWSIGYLDTTQGRKKESVIRFRRKLSWDVSDHLKIAKNVAILKAFFQEDAQ